MAKTLAQTFYPSQTDHDGAWGTDVRQLDGTAGQAVATIQNSHGNSAGTSSITFDPYTTSTTTGDRSLNFGWAINALETSDDGMGGATNMRRIIPNGTWTLRGRLNVPAGGTATGSISVTLTFTVYRVSASGTTRTVLFTATTNAAASNALAAANNVDVTATSDQPLIILEPNETIHVGITSNSTQVAGLLNATVAANIVLQAGNNLTFVQVPAPGVRTLYNQEPYFADSLGRGTVKPMPRIMVWRDAIGRGSFERDWAAFRKFDADAEGVAIYGKLLIIKSLRAKARGYAIDGVTRIIKKFVPAKMLVQGKVSIRARLRIARVAEGNGSFERLVTFVRIFQANVDGRGVLNKAAIFVRKFPARAWIKIRPRIALDWDDLPDAGNATVRKIFQIFDD